MAQINLSKALKLKNRLVGNLADVQSRILQNNSWADYTEPAEPVGPLLDKQTSIRAAILELKTAISHANSKIVRAIYEMSELKSQAVFYQSLNCFDGITKNNYTNTDIQHRASINESARQLALAMIKKNIDTLQDQIDEHNATTHLTVPDEWLAF